MKLRFLFIAIASVILFAACEKEYPSSLANIQLDKTYLSIPAAGGSATLKVTATEPWTLSKDIKVGDNKEYTPAWLTASAVSGQAGETTITFTAEAIDGGREQEFHIECGNVIQYFIVRQGILTPTEATIAEALAAPDGKTFKLTGAIVEWYSNAEQYGNYYIEDETGRILIYGTADKDGKFKNYPVASWGLELGDVVTIEGPRGSHNGSPQMVEVTITNLVKSLVKLVGDGEYSFDKDGGEFQVKAAYKGNGVYVNPETDWLVLSSMDYVNGVPSKLEPSPADTAVISFKVLPNESVVPRSGAVSISSSMVNDDGDVASSSLSISVKQGANAPSLMTIAEGKAAGYAHVKGRIMAICGRGYILADETGAFLAYYGPTFKAENYALGDEIELIDEFAAYNYGLQMSCDGKDGFVLEQKLSEGSGTVAYPTPKVIDKDALAAYVASIKGKDGKKVEDTIPVEYVQVVGTPKKSGNYINIFLDGYTDADLSAYQLPASFDLNSMLDKKVTIRGYTQSVSGGKHLNIVFTELIEGAEDAPQAPYKKVSSVTGGKKYLIVAANVNGKMYAAKPLQSSYTYGRLNGAEIVVSGNEIAELAEEYEFTFTAVEGGFNIIMSDGRALGCDATHDNTFQIGDEHDHVFTVVAREDGTVAIGNPKYGRTLYHGGGTYTNFSMSSKVPDDGVYPWLFERQ